VNLDGVVSTLDAVGTLVHVGSSLTGVVGFQGLTLSLEATIDAADQLIGTITVRGRADDGQTECRSHPTAVTGAVRPVVVAIRTDTLVAFLNCSGDLRIHVELDVKR